MKILSFDCGNKTLAYIYYETEYQISGTVGEILPKVAIIACGVIDILNGEKVRDVSKIERIRRLHTYLENSVIACSKLPINTRVFIEGQPNKVFGGKINLDAICVENALAMYYIIHGPTLADPKAKSTRAFTTDLTYTNIYKKHCETSRSKDTTRLKYVARKKHSTANFLWFIEHNGSQSDIKHVHKSVLDDLADAFLNSFC